MFKWVTGTGFVAGVAGSPATAVCVTCRIWPRRTGVHDDNVTTRFHFVSLPMTLGIGAKASLEAVKVD